MIKKETKYIIRRILITTGVILLLSFIRTCEVKAETQILSPANLSCRNYYGANNSSCGTSNSHNNVTWWNPGTNSTSIRWNSNSALYYEDVNIILFSIVLHLSNTSSEWPVNNVSFQDYSCFFTRTNLNDMTTNSELAARIGISAYCPVNGDINISSGGKVVSVTLDNSGGTAVEKVSLSNITLTKNSELLTIISSLGNLNSYLSPLHQDLTYILQSANNSAYWNEVNSGKLQNIFDIISSQTNTFVNAINSQTTNITNAQNQTTTAVNDMNDTLKDSNVDNPNSSISQMEQNLPTNSVISDLLTLPIRMFQNILNAVNGTCSPFSLGALFGTNLVLPCINIQNYLGSALWGAIDVIFCGIFVLSMRKKFVEIFENITSLKNGGNELE